LLIDPGIGRRFWLPVPGKQNGPKWHREIAFPVPASKKRCFLKIMKDVTMSLTPKAVTCDCGHTFTSNRDRSWCERCANAVYYNEKDKNKYKLSNMYITGVIVAVITFLTYVFMELIASPLLSM
jgi:hypothetical protein